MNEAKLQRLRSTHRQHTFSIASSSIYFTCESNRASVNDWVRTHRSISHSFDTFRLRENLIFFMHMAVCCRSIHSPMWYVISLEIHAPNFIRVMLFIILQERTHTHTQTVARTIYIPPYSTQSERNYAFLLIKIWQNLIRNAIVVSRQYIFESSFLVAAAAAAKAAQAVTGWVEATATVVATIIAGFHSSRFVWRVRLCHPTHSLAPQHENRHWGDVGTIACIIENVPLPTACLSQIGRQISVPTLKSANLCSYTFILFIPKYIILKDWQTRMEKKENKPPAPPLPSPPQPRPNWHVSRDKFFIYSLVPLYFRFFFSFLWATVNCSTVHVHIVEKP